MPLEQALKRSLSLLLNEREVPECVLFGRLDDQLIQALLTLHELLVLVLRFLDPDIVLSSSHDPQDLISLSLVLLDQLFALH